MSPFANTPSAGCPEADRTIRPMSRYANAAMPKAHDKTAPIRPRRPNTDSALIPREQYGQLSPTERPTREGPKRTTSTRSPCPNTR
jgi:hypothetical protein